MNDVFRGINTKFTLRCPAAISDRGPLPWPALHRNCRHSVAGPIAANSE
jgi:hypothetical protein